MKTAIGVGKYGSVLEELRKERIFGICKVEGGFEFEEKCDAAFSVRLTKKQVQRLAKELVAFVESKSFCQNCGQPQRRLTVLDGEISYGWTASRGKQLCDKCLEAAKQ